MPLSRYPVRTSIAVSDIQQAVAFYEGKLGLQVLQSGPSASIADGSRVYGSGGGPALNVYQSATAGKTAATLATWYVDDIDQIVDELTASGVEFVRYDQFEHDAKGITPRAGGGRIAWFQDPDGNTFAVEADV
jgi:catechol 2,3-dioxygenase-like lactoylglutathione lyase family enzyme